MLPRCVTAHTAPALPVEAQGTGIDGAWLQPLRLIPTEGGPVLHMLRPDAPLRPGQPCPAPAASGPLELGELYFSEVQPGHIKGWKRHSRQTQLFAVPSGRMRLVLYDERQASPTRGALVALELGRPDAYALLRVPVGVWYAFAAMGQSPALLCNGADIPHDPQEGEKLPLGDPRIPYAWEDFPVQG